MSALVYNPTWGGGGGWRMRKWCCRGRHLRTRTCEDNSVAVTWETTPELEFTSSSVHRHPQPGRTVHCYPHPVREKNKTPIHGGGFVSFAPQQSNKGGGTWCLRFGCVSTTSQTRLLRLSRPASGPIWPWESHPHRANSWDHLSYNLLFIGRNMWPLHKSHSPRRTVICRPAVISAY